MTRAVVGVAVVAAYLGGTPGGQAQSPAAPATQSAPAAPQAPRPTTTSSTRPTTLTVVVTDGTGAPLGQVKVTATGAVMRQGETLANGTLRVSGVRPGNYRLRFERDGFITLERDVVVRGGQPLEVDAALSPAPAPPPAPPPPAPVESAPTSKASAPPGEARSLDVVDFMERRENRKQPVQEDEVGCSGDSRTRILQVRDRSPEQPSNEDLSLFAVAGEGTLRLGNRDVALSSKRGTIAIVPRGTVWGVVNTGRSLLVLLVVASGTGCS